MSKKPMKPLKVMVVDDDSEFVATLQREAYPHRVLLDHYQNLEAGLRALKMNGERSYAAVILDVICLKDEKQEVPSVSFITAAMTEFRNLAPALTRVILTGDQGKAGDLKSLYDGEAQVFSKASPSDLENLFRLIGEASEKLPHLRLVKKYPEIFEIFEKEYLDCDAETDLIKCLMEMDNYQPTVISSNLNKLRKLQEAMYIQLNKVSPKIVPTEYIEKKVERSDIKEHLRKRDYIEGGKIIDKSLDLVWRLTSEYGAHKPSPAPLYAPTKYTVQMCTFALMDQLLWFKGLMEEEIKS